MVYGRKKKRRMITVFCMFLILLMLFGIGACSGTQEEIREDEETQGNSNEQESSDAVLTEEADASDNTMKFTDVYGKEHTLLIDASAAFHDYERSCFVQDGERMIYSDDTYDSLSGVDVSYFQGDIDWEAVKADGMDFVFIRIGYRGYGESGTLLEDEMFRTNLSGAREAGLLTGVYFFSQAVSEEEASEEAAFVLDLLDDVSLDLPVVYDPEYILDEEGNKIEDARTATLEGSQITENTLTFCKLIEEAGYEAAYYANLLSESEVFDMALLSSYTVWYADYEPQPQTPYAFAFWQYSESGFVDGIEGSVDLNLMPVPES